jgi:tetraprenyl-beta-curcumene synthase
VHQARDSVAVAAALASYRRGILPAARAELRRWRGAAAVVPDPELRAAALAAIDRKGSNSEAIAVFALLAPRPARERALGAMTALQLAIDYLDTLGEQPLARPLEAGLALHDALVDAVEPDAARADWYRAYPRRDDGGFLGALVDACRRQLARLPAHPRLGGAIRSAARRCGEGQAHTHAATAQGAAELERWTRSLPAEPGYEWWEVAAGASSSVAVHALIAAAADRRTTAEIAALTDAAYHPSVGALTVLLDDLVDRGVDEAAGEHNYMRCYRDGEQAGDRLALISSLARTRLEPLPHRGRHAAILAGVAGFYLGALPAEEAWGPPVRERLLGSLGLPARLVLAASAKP